MLTFFRGALSLLRAIVLPASLLLLPLHNALMNSLKRPDCRMTAQYLTMHPEFRLMVLRRLLTIRP